MWCRPWEHGQLDASSHSPCVRVRAEHEYPSDPRRRLRDRSQGPLEVPGALSAPLQIRQTRAHTHARTRLQLKRLSVGPRAGQSLSSPLLLLPPVVLVCARACAGEREAERESVCACVCVCMNPGCEATRTMMTTANHEDDTDANT